MQGVTSRFAQRRVIDTLEEHGANDFLPRATSVISRSIRAGGKAGGTYQAMQLVVGLQQVQPFSFVARNRHRL